MEQLNVTFLITDFHFGGGGERAVANLANYFTTTLNYHVEIISFHRQKTSPVYYLDKNIEIKYLNVDQEPTNSISNVYSKLKTYKRLKAYLNNNYRKSIIISIGPYANIFLAYIKRTNIRRIGYEQNSFKSVNFLWSFFRRISYKHLDATISLTEKDFSLLNQISSKCFVIPNTRSFSVNINRKNNKQILAIGRLSYQKGYNYLLDIFEKLSKHIPDWNLRIVGDGPLHDWLINEIQKRRLQNRISYIPLSENIADEYLNSSIYLMTSRFEGLPLVLLEAQAFGLPIVSFDCDTGPSDVVNDGSDGFLVDLYDVDTMIKKVRLLTDDENLRTFFSLNARLNSDKFSAENVCLKWQKVFSELE